MSDRGPDPDVFAALLCDWCLEVQQGQQVLVNTTALAEPAVRALHRALLQRGAWPLLRVAPPYLSEDFYRYAGSAQLDGFAPLELIEVDYAAFVARALFLDREDPLAAWRELSDRQQRLVERLSSAREIHIEAERTDLRLRVDGRTWVNSDGRRNMPSGEVFTGPLEHSAEGHIYFSVPSSPAGVEVTGVELRFERGEVVAARAGAGRAYLEAALATDTGARFLGELGIGTNSSALHWDLICDLRNGGRMSADGQMLNDNGRLAV